jgi:hypothetical protein
LACLIARLEFEGAIPAPAMPPVSKPFSPADTETPIPAQGSKKGLVFFFLQRVNVPKALSGLPAGVQ